MIVLTKLTNSMMNIDGLIKMIYSYLNKFTPSLPSLDYLLSNNHINNVIVYKYDFSDDEVSKSDK